MFLFFDRVSYNHSSIATRPKTPSAYIQIQPTPRLSLSKSDETIEQTGMENKDRSKSETIAHSPKSISCSTQDKKQDQQSMATNEHRTSPVRKYSSSQLDDDSETLCYIRTQTTNSALTTPPDTPTLRETNDTVGLSMDSSSETKDQAKFDAPEPDNRQPQLAQFAREAKCPSEPLLQETGTNENCTADLLGPDEPDTQASDYSDSSDVSDVENDVPVDIKSGHAAQATYREISNEATADKHGKQLCSVNFGLLIRCDFFHFKAGKTDKSLGFVLLVQTSVDDRRWWNDNQGLLQPALFVTVSKCACQISLYI